jgi:hypothetical protein
MCWQQFLINKGFEEKKVNKFLTWHKQNPDIWQSFEKVALELIDEGIKHYGANAIIEIVRYKLRKAKTNGFKCNNNFAPFYSRIFAFKHKQYANFFEFRELNKK